MSRKINKKSTNVVSKKGPIQTELTRTEDGKELEILDLEIIGVVKTKSLTSFVVTAPLFSFMHNVCLFSLRPELTLP